jgi:hypothetical protein
MFSYAQLHLESVSPSKRDTARTPAPLTTPHLIRIMLHIAMIVPYRETPRWTASPGKDRTWHHDDQLDASSLSSAELEDERQLVPPTAIPLGGPMQTGSRRIFTSDDDRIVSGTWEFEPGSQPGTSPTAGRSSTCSPDA